MVTAVSVGAGGGDVFGLRVGKIVFGGNSLEFDGSPLKEAAGGRDGTGSGVAVHSDAGVTV